MRLLLTLALVLLPLSFSTPTFATTADDCRAGNVSAKMLRVGGFCEQLLNTSSLVGGGSGGGGCGGGFSVTVSSGATYGFCPNGRTYEGLPGFTVSRPDGGTTDVFGYPAGYTP